MNKIGIVSYWVVFIVICLIVKADFLVYIMAAYAAVGGLMYGMLMNIENNARVRSNIKETSLKLGLDDETIRRLQGYEVFKNN